MDCFNGDFKATGKSFETYENVAKQFDENTKMIKFEPAVMSIMHVQKIEDDKIMLKYLQPYCLMKEINGNLVLGKTAFIQKSNVSDCIEDFIPGTSIFKLEGQNVFIDSHFNKTFSDKILELGGSFITTPSIIRDTALCHLVEQEKIPAGKFLIRKRGNRLKAFGFYTERFKRVPFLFLSDYAKTRKDLSILKWKIDQDSAQIYLDMTEYERFGMVPGVMIETSDTSMAPTQAVSYWRNKNGECLYLESFKIKHSTTVSMEDMEEIVNLAINSHNVYIPKFNSMKEKMTAKMISMEHMPVKVKELSSRMDIAKIIGKKKNEEFIQAVIRRHKNEKDVSEFTIIKDFIGLDSILDISPRQKRLYRNIILPQMLAA